MVATLQRDIAAACGQFDYQPTRTRLRLTREQAPADLNVVDSLSPAHRSWNMSRIRNRNTKPEVIVRSLLHRMGYRFTITGPLNRKLPGRPDIVLPKHRTAIFVHGCFWHRHEGWLDTTTPKTRTEWWLQKLTSNVARDQKNRSALRESGWNVVVVWECEVAKPSKLQDMLNRQVRRLVCYPAAERTGPIALVAEHPGSYRSRDARQSKKE